MNTKQRITAGAHIASQSFLFLWQNQHLLIYTVIAIIINSLMLTLTHNIGLLYLKEPLDIKTGIELFVQLFIKDKTLYYKLNSLGILHYGITILQLFFHYALMLFIALCLTLDVATTDSSYSIKNTILRAFSYTKFILAWAGASSLNITILQFITAVANNHKIVVSIELLGTISWIIFSLFMLQAIIIEQLSLKESFMTIQKILSYKYVEIISGELWIGLIYLLTWAPIIAFHLLSGHHYFILGSKIALIIINCIITTTHTLFCIFLFKKYKEKIVRYEKITYPPPY